MRRVRLVIADRRPIVLQGFVSLLEAQPDFEVVACCLDGASCLAAIRRLTPDVVLLEDGFTDVTASDILAVVDDEALSSRLVFFTATVACSDLARALATGACGAISMNAQPETLVQSLRLEAPGADRARVGNEANGTASFGNNVLAVLTVNERTIMDLVAEGLSDSQIAKILGVSLEIVGIHIDHARQKLGINSRTELAALALSRRYGAMGILAAAILAALDDSPGHAATESFAVMAANGCAEVVTIKISRKEAPARGASKERIVASSATSSSIGKLVDPVAEIAASQFAQAALNTPRPGSSSYSIFLVAAFAALIYELDGASHPAQAFNFGDDIVTLSTASDASEVSSVFPGVANLGGTAVYDGASAFEFVQGDAIGTDGSEGYVGNAHAEDGGRDRQTPIPHGSGAVDVVAAAVSEAAQRDLLTNRDNGSNQDRSQSDSRAAENTSDAAKREAPGDDLNHGQSQKTQPESDHNSGAAKGHAKNEAAGDGLNHGQSQKALHGSDHSSSAAKGQAKNEVSEDGSSHSQSEKKNEALGDGSNQDHSQKAAHALDNRSAAKGHAEHEAAGEDSNRGHAHGDLQALEDDSSAGKQHAQHPQEGNPDADKPHQDISGASVNFVTDAHSASKNRTEKIGGPSSDNADQDKSVIGSELGDSFHFKSDSDKTPSDMYDLQQLGHGNGRAYGDGQHAVSREWPEPVQDVDILDSHHDHSSHANLHVTNDLIV